MTEQELALLLTVARILRAYIREAPQYHATRQGRMDCDDLTEALAPWESNLVSLHPNGERDA